ncbi:hypothetical protein ABPG72_002804 [Tetrahymena utriculariae]
MKILIVNGYPDTKEGLQSFLGFRYLVQKIFMEQTIIVDMDIEFVIRKINELDNILYKSTSTSITTSSGRNFDNFDMIFMNGDPYLRPYNEGGCLTHIPQSSSKFQDLSSMNFFWKIPLEICTILATINKNGLLRQIQASTTHQQLKLIRLFENSQLKNLNFPLKMDKLNQKSTFKKLIPKNNIESSNLAVSSADKMRDRRLRDEAKNQSSLKLDKIVCERTSSKFMSIHQESGSKVLKEFREKINQQENQKIIGNSRQPKQDEQSGLPSFDQLLQARLQELGLGDEKGLLDEEEPITREQTTKLIPGSLKSKERKPAIRVKQGDLFKDLLQYFLGKVHSKVYHQINISQTPLILNNDPQKSQEELQREQFRKESQKNLGPKSIILSIQKSKVHSNIDPNFIPNYVNQTPTKTTAKNHQYRDTLKKNSVGNQDFLLIIYILLLQKKDNLIDIDDFQAREINIELEGNNQFKNQEINIDIGFLQGINCFQVDMVAVRLSDENFFKILSFYQFATIIYLNSVFVIQNKQQNNKLRIQLISRLISVYQEKFNKYVLQLQQPPLNINTNLFNQANNQSQNTKIVQGSYIHLLIERFLNDPKKNEKILLENEYLTNEQGQWIEFLVNIVKEYCKDYLHLDEMKTEKHISSFLPKICLGNSTSHKSHDCSIIGISTSQANIASNQQHQNQNEKKVDIIFYNEHRAVIIDWKFSPFSINDQVYMNDTNHFIDQIIEVMKFLNFQKEVTLLIVPLKKVSGLNLYELTSDEIELLQKEQVNQEIFYQTKYKKIRNLILSKQYNINQKYLIGEGKNQNLSIKEYFINIIELKKKSQLEYYGNYKNCYGKNSPSNKDQFWALHVLLKEFKKKNKQIIQQIYSKQPTIQQKKMKGKSNDEVDFFTMNENNQLMLAKQNSATRHKYRQNKTVLQYVIDQIQDIFDEEEDYSDYGDDAYQIIIQEKDDDQNDENAGFEESQPKMIWKTSNNKKIKMQEKRILQQKLEYQLQLQIMEIEQSAAYEELVKNYQRDINCLIDDDRNLRKKGLTTILKQTFATSTPTKELLQFFQINVLKNLLRTIDDSIEKNRELAQNIIQQFYIRAKDSVDLIDREVTQQILQKLCSRVNTIPYAEQSEEIRLLITQNMIELVKLFSQHFVPIVGDFAVAISRLIQDQYPEVKKTGATLVEECSKQLKQYIGHHGLQIAKSLAKNFEHQHSKVRKVTVQALTTFLLCEGAGCLYEHVNASYNKVINDKINEVRKTAYESVAQLLNSFSVPNLRNFESDLVLLLLNSLSDEVQENIQLGQKLIEETGMSRMRLAIENNEKVDQYI